MRQSFIYFPPLETIHNYAPLKVNAKSQNSLGPTYFSCSCVYFHSYFS